MNAGESFRGKVWGWLFLIILGTAALVKGYAIQPSIEEFWPGDTGMADVRWEKSYREDQEILEYRYRICENGDKTLRLCIKTYLPEFQVYLDDTEIYSFSDAYAVKGSSQHLIRIPRGSSGKTLIVRMDNSHSNERQIHMESAWIGEENEVLVRLLIDNLYAVIFGVLTCLMGTVNLVAVIRIRKSFPWEMRISFLYLSAFIFISGIWVVTDSEILLFITDRQAVVSLVSFVSFMIMPTGILKFVSYMLGEKKILEILCRMFFVMAAMYLMNFQFPIIPGYLLLLPVHLMCFYSIVIILRMGHEKLKNRENKEMRKILRGFWLLGVFCIAAFIVYYINPTFQYALFYCMGIILFTICLMDAALVRLYEQVEKSANIAAYKRLAYMDTMTGMENRAAFMEEQKRNVSSQGRTYILLDVNNLKWINDRYGHQAGDILINAAAKYIQDTFGEAGKCYRIGGDEFVVILKKSSAHEAADTLSAMQARIEKENKKRTIPLTIAAGYAVQEHEDDTAEQLLRKADANMYAEKKRMKKEGMSL